MTHPACRLDSGLFRSNGCPLDREEDCDLCGLEAFEKWHCYREVAGGVEMLCPPEGCSLNECAREHQEAGHSAALRTIAVVLSLGSPQAATEALRIAREALA